MHSFGGKQRLVALNLS